jgi:arsenical pump membrane protein
MFLIIGNPTNIYLATSLNIGFLEYTKVMFLPTIFSGVASFLVLFLIFNKSLRQKMPEDRIVEDIVITEKVSMIIGLAHLIACILLLVVSSYIGLEMWYICLGFCLSLYISVFIYKLIKKEKVDKVTACFKQAPWELIPFVLSMFVIVLSLTNCGFTELVASLLGSENAVWTYGISSFFVANIINNIPMSVLYSSIVPYLSGSSLTAGIFASVIGSNIGAFLSPIGALAGIMFSSIMNNHGVKFTFVDFLKYGVVVAIPTLLASLLGLYLILLI